MCNIVYLWLRYLLPLRIGGAVNKREEEDYGLNQLMMTVFSEQSLALPGSSNKTCDNKSRQLKNLPQFKGGQSLHLVKFSLNRELQCPWFIVCFNTSLGDFCQCQQLFVSLKEALNQTLCSLPASDRLYIVSNSLPKTSCNTPGTSVAGTRKWSQTPWKYSLILASNMLKKWLNHVSMLAKNSIN